ncbi:hypothetical protein BZL39_C00190 [Zygosaccharomyces parabailii]|nr:hypothetical protein BZL39_C00190 [Zygosaccharomyces parabailii]
MMDHALVFSNFFTLFLILDFVVPEWVPLTDKSLLHDANFGRHNHLDIFLGEETKPHIRSPKHAFLRFKTHVVMGTLFFGWLSSILSLLDFLFRSFAKSKAGDKNRVRISKKIKCAFTEGPLKCRVQILKKVHSRGADRGTSSLIGNFEAERGLNSKPCLQEVRIFKPSK